jgi:hypothetical protein
MSGTSLMIASTMSRMGKPPATEAELTLGHVRDLHDGIMVKLHKYQTKKNRCLQAVDRE